MKRLDQLTFTRFLAILLVMIYHGGGGVYFGWANRFPISAILSSAPTAVSYLYVLSGFIMSLVYFRPREKFDIQGYWSARFVRIYPLYFVSFLLICYYYIDSLARIKPQKILANIFVLQAWWPPYAQSFNYASWSMTVEFFFYAVFPFFVIWAYRQSTKGLIRVSLSLWITTQLVHFVLWAGYFPAWELFIVYNPIFHLSSFILGVVGGIWYLRESNARQTSQILNSGVMLTSLFLVSGYTILSNVYTGLPHGLQPMAGLLSPLFALLIITLAMDTTWVSRFLSNRWLVILGETAFVLYILEVPVIWLYKRALFSSGLGDPDWILSVTYLPLMISLGLVAYFYIDPPIRNWLKNILKGISVPLLLVDLAIIAASAYLSFYFRFDGRREFLSYRNTAILMFWTAFLFRTSLSVGLGTLNPFHLHMPFRQVALKVFTSITAGSGVMFLLIYLSHLANWIGNFPRSVFVIDWAIVFGLSIFVRYIFRSLKFHKDEPLRP